MDPILPLLELCSILRCLIVSANPHVWRALQNLHRGLPASTGRAGRSCGHLLHREVQKRACGLPEHAAANAAAGDKQCQAVRKLAQRRLAQWTLQPMAMMIAEEASTKLKAPVSIDVMRPLQAFDAGGRARALKTTVDAIALAKEAGLDVSETLKLVDW